MASPTARAVSAETLRVPFSTCDTVDTETPARFATSSIVATIDSPKGGCGVGRARRRKAEALELELVDVGGRHDLRRAENHLAAGTHRVVAEPAGLEGFALLAGQLALRHQLGGVVGQVSQVLDVPP